MPVDWCIRQDSHLQTLRSKRRMIVISPRMLKWPAKPKLGERRLEPEAGLEPATTRLGGDNPILRPVEIVLNGIALATHTGRARGEQRSVRCDMSSAGNAVLFQA